MPACRERPHPRQKAPYKEIQVPSPDPRNDLSVVESQFQRLGLCACVCVCVCECVCVCVREREREMHVWAWHIHVYMPVCVWVIPSPPMLLRPGHQGPCFSSVCPSARGRPAHLWAGEGQARAPWYWVDKLLGQPCPLPGSMVPDPSHLKSAQRPGGLDSQTALNLSARGQLGSVWGWSDLQGAPLGTQDWVLEFGQPWPQGATSQPCTCAFRNSQGEGSWWIGRGPSFLCPAPFMFTKGKSRDKSRARV